MIECQGGVHRAKEKRSHMATFRVDSGNNIASHATAQKPKLRVQNRFATAAEFGELSSRARRA